MIVKLPALGFVPTQMLLVHHPVTKIRYWQLLSRGAPLQPSRAFCDICIYIGLLYVSIEQSKTKNFNLANVGRRKWMREGVKNMCQLFSNWTIKRKERMGNRDSRWPPTNLEVLTVSYCWLKNLWGNLDNFVWAMCRIISNYNLWPISKWEKH